MDLRRLQVFAKVYECRSFSRAAEEVYLSQPTVSGHIKSLEEELGVRLFDRLGREILPTKAAELLFGYAKRILEMVDEAQSSVDAFLGRLRGQLVVGGSTIPGQYVLPAFIGRFHLLHPEVKITLNIGDTRQIVSGVLSGELEVGVVGAQVDEERLTFTPLDNDEIVLIAWPGHPYGDELTLPQVAEVPLVFREPGSGTGMSVNHMLQAAGIDLGELEVVSQMGSTMAILQAVRAKLGLGFVSRRAVSEDLQAGKIQEVEVKGLQLKRSFYLVTRNKRSHSPAAQAFIALCLAGLEED